MSSNFWTYNEVNSVHIELSSKCNAACPGCQRFDMNSPNLKKDLVKRSVTIDQFKQWFPLEFISQVDRWIFCGTYGDPIAARDVLPILEYVCQNSDARIQLNTNAGLGSTTLFTDIGKLFVSTRNRNTDRYVTFSIDGLSDTNHIYRRNVVWDKVWENLMAYIDTGANAMWDYLHFKHNSHQVEEARALAKKYKIRFLLKNPFGLDKVSMPAYNKNLEFDYIIEHATDNGYPPYIPSSSTFVAPPVQPIKTDGCITCYSKRQETDKVDYDKKITEIYVDSSGKVLPCCFVSVGTIGTVFDWGIQLQEVQKNMGNANSLVDYSLKQILDNGVLEVWSNSWENKELAVCWTFCGKATEKERVIDTLWTKK